VARVAGANAEAITALPAGGTAVVPAEARELDPFLARDDLVVRTFDPEDVGFANGRGTFRVGDEVVELELPFTQRHQAVNALAALHAYDALGLPLEQAGEGAGDIELSPWRGEELALAGAGFVVNDAYNASPDSMFAALRHLAERAGDRRRIAILGEMAELGDAGRGYHLAVGDLARELDVLVIGVGEPARAYRPDAWAADADEAIERAREVVRPDDAVLVKASRAVGLEGIAERIANFARE
jgi:UDP-N-acetylmuramoyl-tripeptide--D-alanyl-D-alanine ligase